MRLFEFNWLRTYYMVRLVYGVRQANIEQIGFRVNRPCKLVLPLQSSMESNGKQIGPASFVNSKDNPSKGPSGT